MGSFARFAAVVSFVFALLPSFGFAAPQPAVRVAVFSNGTYIDEATPAPGAEGPNVRAALSSLGFSVTPFVGITATDWRNATNAADVLLIPEIEVSNLNAALAADARQTIHDYVAAGGTLVVHGDVAGNISLLLNATFGFATVFGGDATGMATIGVSDPGNGTRFLKGPGNPAGNNGMYALGTLPAGARTLYRTGAFLVVVYIPVGAGRIVYLGWDWFNGAPNGAQDGGWNDLLRRAVLEGRAPTRRIALFDDPVYVDTSNLPDSESDDEQATLLAQDDLVTTFTGTAQAGFDAALGLPRRPNADVLVIPELEVATLAPALPAGSVTSIRNFVGTGGTLVVHGDFAGSGYAFLNTVFGFTTAIGANVSASSSTRTANTAGTLFVETPATLDPADATHGITGLPVGAKSLYENSGATVVAQIPFGEGTIFYLGYDWFDALPSGTQDGGWRAVLDAAVRTAPPARRVAVWNDPAFVNADLGILNEQAGMRASLASRGHVAKPFQGTSPAAWSNALAGADVVVVPDLEVADPAPALNATVRDEIVAFVKRGGLLVASAGTGSRGTQLLNALFGFALTPSGNPGPYAAGTDRLGTPFTLGAASLPNNNQTLTFANLPAGARSIYANGADSALMWAQVGAGHVLLLGWDWFNAQPAGGAADGGWVEALDLAVQSTHSRARRVAVLDDPTYVDSSDVFSAESDNVQATLGALDHSVRPFVGIAESDFRSALAGADVLLIPENELAPLAPALTPTASKAVRDFVAAGGALVVHGFANAGTLNAIFGGTLSSSFASDPIGLSPLGQLGTRFAGGPPTLLNANETDTLVGLPFGGKTIYTEAGGNSAVAWAPYGLGRIIFLGYDWYDAAPVGTQDGGWVDVLDRAVQEARPRSRTTAVFDDALYTDTSNTPSSESDVVQASVIADGHVSVPFVGITPANLSAGLAKTQALVVPDLEVGNLGAALSQPAQQVLRDYVARGGTLITSPNESGNGVIFLNTVFNLALTQSVAASTTFGRQAAAVGTVFANGPAQLNNMNATISIASLPATASVIYGNGAESVVVRIPYGAGELVALGWDFFGSPPYLGADVGQAAWFDVLGRAIDSAPPYARRIALFADPAFIDIAGGSGSEGTNLEAQLLRQEHAVVPFTGTAQSAFDEALSRADVLLVPEQEVAPLTPALNAATLGSVSQFVRGGGGLVVHGNNFGPSATQLVNALFGTALTETANAGTSSAITLTTVNTKFAGGPLALLEEDATTGITGGIPVGGVSLYVDGGVPKTPVAMLNRGYGRVVYLGWDFFNAAPVGPTNDPAWFDVLDRAVREGTAGDADADGFAAGVDNCPITADPSQLDGDGDGVGNACDSCVNVANPRVLDGDAAFLANNLWATLSGAQRDDDHDGYGNKCDGKFPGVGGLLVNANDLTQFRASNGKARTGDTCGTLGTRPCAIFDLDENALLVNAADLTVFRGLNGKAPGPKCTTCPLPCSAGANGTCN